MRHYVQLKLFATLANNTTLKNTDLLEIKPETTVEELMITLDVKLEEIKLIFINGIAKKINSKLYNGDTIAIFPSVGGG